MPETLAEIGAYIVASYAAVSAGTATFLQFATVIAINTVISAGLSAAASSLLGGSPSLRPDKSQQTFKQSVAPRRRFYGKCKMGGSLAFLAVDKVTYANAGHHLNTITLFGSDQFYAIDEHWLGDKQCTLSGNTVTNVFVQDGQEKASVYWQLGRADDTGFTDSHLATALPAWDSDHRLRGIAAGLSVLGTANAENFLEFYPSGPQPYNVVARTAMVVDPRDTPIPLTGSSLFLGYVDDTDHFAVGDRAFIRGVDVTPPLPDGLYSVSSLHTSSPRRFNVFVEGGAEYDNVHFTGPCGGEAYLAKYTDNWQLCLLDFLIHKDGYRLPADLVWREIGSWKANADICDEPITQNAGGTQPRYRLALGYEFVTPPKDTLRLMLAAAGGYPRMTASGGVIVEPARYIEPTVVLGDDAIISYTGFRRGLPKPSMRNEIRARYTSEVLGFTEQEADAWRNEESIGRDGLQTATLDLLAVPIHSQCRRLQKIEAYRQNAEWIGTIITNAYGMDAMGEPTVRVQIPELAVDIPCERTSFEQDPNTGVCTIGVRSMPPEAFDFNPATEEGTPPSGPSPE